MAKKMLYQTNSLSALYYDVEHTHRMGALGQDVAFYRKQAKKAKGPILELASGTGRITIPIAKAGCDITGLELSPQMLKLARAKITPELKQRLRFFKGNMVRFSLKRKFALVIIPFRSFLAMLTVKDQRSCLASIRKHLRPGGKLILNIFDPMLEYLVEPAKVAMDNTVTLEDGSLRLRTRRLENDLLNQVFIEEFAYELSDRQGRIIRRSRELLQLRWIYHWEMRHLLELSGFKVLACHSDFKRGKPRHGAEQVWTAVRN